MRILATFVSTGLFTAMGLGAGSAWATTYKVGPSQTYKQPSAVTAMLVPGDVVEIDGDATYAGGITFDRPGSAAAKITVRGIAKNGKRPVLSGGTSSVEAAGDHYVFEGLDLTAASARCFYHHADDITLRDSVVHDCPTHGILGADADTGSFTMEYVEVYGSGGGIYHHQVYVATDETAHPGSVFRMQFCYVHDSNGGHNVKSRAERNEIRYNWIEGAQYHELELIGPDGQDESLAREDSDVVGNVLVKRNTFYVVRFGGDGTGQTFGRYRFVNNTVIVQPNASAVFHLFDGIDSVEMHNNVFSVNGSGGVKLMGAADAAWDAGEQIAGSNNWVQRGSTLTPSQWTGTIVGDTPGFVVGANDPRPSAASALVNAGTTAMSGPPGHEFPSPLASPLFQPPIHAVIAPGGEVARPSVAAVDIGAFEYGTAAPTAPGSSAGDDAGLTTPTGGNAGSGTGGGTASGANATGGVGAAGSNGATSTAAAGGSAGSDGSGDSAQGCGVTRSGPASSSSTAALTLAALAFAGLSRRRRPGRATR